MLINYFLIGLVSFIAGTFFISLSKRFVLKYKILSSHGVPLAGGLSIGLSFFAVCFSAFFFYNHLSKEIIGILLSSFIILLFGVIDDKRELSVSAKFVIQAIAAALLVLFGVRTYIVSLGDLLNIIMTFIWVMAITNSFNHLDIMDGLAGGVAIISSLGFFIISLINQDIGSAILSLVIAGVSFSFLLYNFPPAKIYLGNSGSHFLGFALASIAMMISYAPLERKVGLFSPILILGFPIFDTAFLVAMRLKKNILPFKKSDDHLALRLLRNGYPKNKTLFLMLALSALFVFSGIVLSKVTNLCGSAILTFIILACLRISVKVGKLQ